MFTMQELAEELEKKFHEIAIDEHETLIRTRYLAWVKTFSNVLGSA